MTAHDGAEDSGETDVDARRRRLVALLDDAGVALRTEDGSATARVPAGGPTASSVRPPRWTNALWSQLNRLCVVTVLEVGVDGAGITVMGSADAARSGHRDQLAATGASTERLEDLQLTTGEGPCLDAYSAAAPVLVAELAAETTRWPGFAPEALRAGAAAVFSLPLQVGAVRLGTLDLHRCTVGGLSDDQLADAVALAGLATEALLELAGNPEPAEGPLTADTSRTETRPEGSGPDRQRRPPVTWLPHVHANVHVASGMVSAQRDIDVGAAMLRIRAYAFSRGEPVDDVARRIIDRDLVLGDVATEQPDRHGHPPANPHESPQPLDTSPETDD